MPAKLLTVLILFLCQFAVAQNLENYRNLSSTGSIPGDFTSSSSEKFHKATNQLPAGQKGKRKPGAPENFLLESNFLIDQVLSSGRVLFNDSVSSYLGHILDTILANDTALRNQIRVYAVRSSIVNSFTTDNGIILVNIGLIAQLETEAQLAFILCHELAHFTHKHVLNAYLQNEELKQNIGDQGPAAFNEKLLAKSRYSKDLESAADRLGLERFSTTDYGTDGLINVFEMMRYAHLPFDDIPFDKEYFNGEIYRIDDSYYLNRVRPAEALASSDPAQDTHPSPMERQQDLIRNLNKYGNQSGKTAMVSDARFNQIRTVCRFELSSLYLKSNRPIMSIYNTYLLLADHPENAYLKKCMAQSLYTLSKFKNGGNFGQVHPGFSHIEGESQQLYHLFYRLAPIELCVLATRQLWQLRLEFPEDRDLANMSDDLLKDLMLRYHTPGMFSQDQPPQEWNIPDTAEIDSKYDRLKIKSRHNPNLTMVKYALVDLFKREEFRLLFDSLARDKWVGKMPNAESESLVEGKRDDPRYWKNHGFALGADKVVVVSPTYSKLDLRKSQQHRFLRSEAARSKLMAQIDRSAKILNLETQILTRSALTENDVADFNDITFLNEWVDQRFVESEVGMVNYPVEDIDRIIEKYGTEFYSWTGVINYRENKRLMYFYLLYALIPPAIPLAAYYLARPNYDTYYYFITFNLRTGEAVQVNYNNFRKRDARDMINSSVYDSLWQVKRKAKQKG